jgi:RNA polymerase sigma-70 factor (ECF subfamily)
MSEQFAGVAQCLEKVRQGDGAAACTLVEELYPLVQKIVRSRIPAFAAEEDMIQEVFMKMFSKLDQYETRDNGSFEHWVSRLAFRTCLDRLRYEARRPEIRWSELTAEQAAWLEFMVLDGSSPPGDSAHSAREAVELLLSRLSPPDRTVISLLDLEQKSVKEISALTGWSQVGVKVRAFRARQRLRKLAFQLKEQIRYEGL